MARDVSTRGCVHIATCHFSVRPSLGQDLAYTTNKMVIRKIAEESRKREIESEKAKERGQQLYNSYK